MRFASKTGKAETTAATCLVLPRHRASAVAEALGVAEAVELALAATPAREGALVTIPLPGKVKRMVAVGSDVAKVKAERFRRDMATVAKALATMDVADATVCVDDFEVPDHDTDWKVRTALAAVSDACYRFNEYKSKPPKAARLRRVSALVARADSAAAARAAQHAQALDAGLTFARDLGNHPPNICDPTFVAEAASGLAGEGVSVEVKDEDEMRELGMGAFLSVSQGSETPAKMVIVRYDGADSDAAPFVLVGKGITFDTGGINIKSTAGMEQMKFDMCGAASVLGAAKAAIDAALPINLIAIAAAAENMPSGRATRPSDIVTTMSGQTVEIMNTDAEGRLVLCDALTYVERFKPAAVVDVATLTGAQITALGTVAAAMYANDDDLAEALERAATYAHDRMWRMPLWSDYAEDLRTPFADVKNVGGRAGSITAACFLARFAEAYPWAHLDVAGPAMRGGSARGATGRPVSALFQYLIDQAA